MKQFAFKTLLSLGILFTWNLAQAQFQVNGALVGTSVNACKDDTLIITYFNTGGSPFTWSSNGTPPITPFVGDTLVFYVSSLQIDSIFLQGTGITDTLQLNIGIPPSPTLQVAPKYLCHDDVPTALSGGVPTGGYFTGSAISGGFFNPSQANPGWNTVQYNVVGTQGCVGTAVDSIYVNGPVNGSILIDGPTNTGNTNFNGQSVFTDCNFGGSTSNILLYYTPDSSISSYIIDFGDGTMIPGSGSFPASGLNHTYQSVGLYNGSITTVSDSGCTTITELNYFYGGSPSVGSSTAGNQNSCLSPGDSITFTFSIIIFPGVNPPGTLYEVVYNDGSPPDTFSHPPPTSVTHTFTQSSCDASPVGNYQNAFFFRVNATNPCATGSSLVEPIIISENPQSAFSIQDTVCEFSPVTIVDQSYKGVAISGNGGACDSTLKILWNISPNTYSVLTGDIGIQPGGSLNPNIWTSGTSSLDVEFTAPGVYTVQQLVGLGTACEIDSSIQTICVQESIDSATIVLQSIGTSNCAPTTYRLSADAPMFSFCEQNDFIWSITPNTFSIDSGSVNSSTLKLTFNSSGQYLINLNSQNSCSSLTVTDTVQVYSAPFVQFVDTAFYCQPDTANFFIDPVHLPGFNNGLDTVSFQYSITPNTGWTVTSGSLNQQFPSIAFNAPGTYNVNLVASNSCGQASDNQYVVVQNPTITNLTLQDSVCLGSSVPITASTINGSPPYSYLWNIQNQQFTGDSVFIGNVIQSIPFTLQVTDIRGCVSIIDSALHVFSPAQLNSFGFSICQTDTIQGSFSLTGGTAPFQYSWSSATGLSDSTILNPIFYGVDVLSMYSLTITDARGCIVTETITVNVTNAPPADGGPNIQACFGDTIVLAQGSIPGPYDYEWRNAQGVVVDSILNPSVLVNDSFMVYILKVSSTSSCFAFDTVIVNADPVPGSFFGLSDTLCLNDIAVLSDTNANVNAREWRRNGVLIGGAMNLTDSLINTTSSIAQWVYSLRTISNSGCESTSFDTVYIRPFSALSIGTNNTCFGDTASFTSSFAPSFGLTNFSWDFGDNTFGNGQNEAHYYAAPGSYTVRLSAIDSEGCTQVVYDTINVALLPQTDFQVNSACPLDTLCLNTAYIFSDQSTSPSGAPITNWYWDFDNDGVIDDLTQNPSYIFTNPGTQVISLASETSTGCSSAISQTYFVQDELTAFVSLSEDSICGPYLISDSVFNTGNIDSYLWELFRFNSQGNRVVAFSSNSPNPVLPTAPAPSGGTYNWIWGLTVSNCCESVSSFDTVRVSSIAIPNFQVSPDSGCTPLNSVFQFDGLILGTPDSLFLDFGDGQQDTLLPTPIWSNGQVQYQWGQITHQYVYGGNGDTTYFPSVRISNGCGDSTLSRPVFVQVNTVQSFFNPSTSSGCAPLNVVFDNLSFGATNFNWCFEYDTISGTCSGATSSDSLPQYMYNQPGNYLVRLIANNGCSYDTSFQTINVQVGINAALQTPSQACVGDTIALSALVSAPGSSLSYEWDFGNGQTATALNATTEYDSAGTYVVTLLTQTTGGCRDSSIATIEILPSPIVDFGFISGCFGAQPVAFFDSSSTNGGVITGTIWDFGDGNSSTQLNPNHVYANPGTYTVRLTKFNSLGCDDYYEQNVIVYPDPQLDFQFSLIGTDSCGLPQTYQFNNLSQQSSGYLWDFDFNNPGNATSMLNNPSYTFNSVGQYTIALIGENAFGCSDTVTQTLLVRPELSSFFAVNPQSACEGTVFTFTDLSVQDSAFDPIVTWNWDFGDGTSIIGGSTVQHVYGQPGIFNVQLTVTSSLGCSDNQFTIAVEVLERPISDFIIQSQTLTEVDFSNLSQNVLSGVQYGWSFGDGDSSTIESPTHTYSEAGTYPVILVTLNPNGCLDTMISEVVIDDLFRLYIPTAYTPNGDGKNEVFYIQGTGIDRMQLDIYDRWGKKVFESTDPNLGWDGFMPNGDPAQQDNYHYRLQVENYLLSQIVTRNGRIALIR